MKHVLKQTLAVAALMACMAGGAHATEGWYGRLDVGRSVDGGLDGDVSDGVSTATFSPDFDDKWMGALGVGYAMRNGFRLEGELSHRANNWGPTTLNAFDTDVTGDARALALMANLYYDFNHNGALQPYLGVGVGAARVRVGIDGSGEGKDTRFAYQAMAGIAYAATERLTFDLGYRIFRVRDLDVSEAFAASGIQTPSSNVDYEHQAVTLGVRWQFGGGASPPPPPVQAYQPPAPMPPPPPPPVACAAADFVVYFDWDHSDLNQAAMETIDAAARGASACNPSAVMVVGYTDTSGSTAYNAELSERRASIVRDALTSRGMAASLIRTDALGETNLAQPTRDGVREPLNRRTAVTISFR